MFGSSLCPVAPSVQELAGPGGTHILPETLKILLQQISLNRAEVHLQKFGEPAALFFGQMMLPGAPRHILDDHATVGAVHTSHPVDEKHGEPPHADELEQTGIGSRVVC